MDKSFISYAIEDRSYVAFVKREIHSQLLQSRFSKLKIAEIDIIVAELTSNLIKHAGSGELLYKLINNGEASILEIVCIDNGPGMTDVQKMMKDGVSTSNTLGQGLGAIRRLSNEFQVFSIPKWGTISYTMIATEEKKEGAKYTELEVNALTTPKPKEIVCGDGYSVKKKDHEIHIFLGDGLGHGEHAHNAVAIANDFFMHCEESDPVEIIRQMHQHVRKTRGLVGTVAILDLRSRNWKICGVGNITTRLYGGIMFKHYTSYNGIIGLNIPNSIKESIMPAEKNQQIIMASDGLRTRWDFTKYPSILKYDSMLLAAALYKDFSRKTDDSSVFIGKVNFEK